MSMPTRRQSAAVAWTAGEDRLRLLLDGTADHAIAMLGVQGMVLTWNAGAVELLGWAAEEIVGQHVSVLYPREVADRQIPQRHLEAALASGRFEEEDWRVRKDSSRFWASVVMTPLRDRSGRLRGFGSVTRDQSDRLRAQDLHAVFDAAATAILVVDTCGLVVFANAAVGEAFERDHTRLLGAPVDLVLPGAGSRLPALEAAGGTATRMRGRRGDGSDVVAEVSVHPAATSRGPLVTVTVRLVPPPDLTRLVAPRPATVSLPADPQPARGGG